MTNKSKRLFFRASIFLCFITIFIFEMLTPMLMDDMTYLSEVNSATSVLDLFRQEYHQYISWTGRSVAHTMMRLMMYADLRILSGGRFLFNIISALVFTRLTYLMYANVKKEEDDIKLYAFIVLLLWVFGVSFAETILWETGACNYLFTTTIIWEFITAFRKESDNVLKIPGMFVLGILAGWCNENTSGACLLFAVFLAMVYMRRGNKIRPYMISGIGGNIIGLAFMVLAPGNALRASQREELHSGLIGMAARFLSITKIIKAEFFVLLVILIVLVCLLLSLGKKISDMTDVIVYTALWFITCYVLVATTTPQSRALFGAGIFLMLAVVSAFSLLKNEDRIVDAMRNAAIYALCLFMFFTYLDSGANLARIYREEQERYAYLEEYAKTGEEDVVVPMLRPDFKTRYSAAYECDITDHFEYWTNMMMANYYGFKTLLGVDREEWTEY